MRPFNQSWNNANHLHQREVFRSRWRGRWFSFRNPQWSNSGKIPFFLGARVRFYTKPSSRMVLDAQAGSVDPDRVHFSKFPAASSLGVLVSPRFISAPRGRDSRVWMMDHAELRLGPNVMIQPGVDISLGRNSRLEIAANCYLSADVTIYVKTAVKMGEGCMIGQRVLMMDYDGHPLVPSSTLPSEAFTPLTGGKSEEIVLGKNVWVGHGAVLLKGVTVGDGAIIGANACVTQDVPACSIVAGNPARVVKEGWTWRR